MEPSAADPGPDVEAAMARWPMLHEFAATEFKSDALVAFEEIDAEVKGLPTGDFTTDEYEGGKLKQTLPASAFHTHQGRGQA